MSSRSTILPSNPYFQANRSIVEAEIVPGNTVTFISEVNLTQVERIRRCSGADKPSYTAFVAKAIAIALLEFPYANRRLVKRWWTPLGKPRLQKFDHCDIAIACERDIPGVEYCAFADIIRDAEQKPLRDITRWLQALGTSDVNTNKQWRDFSGVITRLPNWISSILIRLPLFSASLWEKYRGASVLISSPAKYGVDSVVTTWTWPLGFSFGLVKDRPIVKDGQVIVARTFNLVLNFDRRVMAGAQGARFFKKVIDLLEQADKHLADVPPPRPQVHADPPVDNRPEKPIIQSFSPALPPLPAGV